MGFPGCAGTIASGFAPGSANVVLRACLNACAPSHRQMEKHNQ